MGNEGKKNGNSGQNWILIPEIIIIVFLFAISIFTILSSKNDGLASSPITGTCLLPVKSNSMKPEFQEGDLVIGKKIKNIEDLKVEDIITYRVYQSSGYFLNTHRIVRIDDDGTIWCQGDNHEMSQVAEKVNAGDILAIYKGSIKGVGKIFTFFEDRTNYTIFILIPLLLLFLWNIYSFMKVLFESKRQTMIENAVKNGEISDEVKALAIQEYLEKQKAMAEANNKAVENSLNENAEEQVKEETSNEVEPEAAQEDTNKSAEESAQEQGESAE